MELYRSTIELYPHYLTLGDYKRTELLLDRRVCHLPFSSRYPVLADSLPMALYTFEGSTSLPISYNEIRLNLPIPAGRSELVEACSLASAGSVSESFGARPTTMRKLLSQNTGRGVSLFII